MAQATLCSIRTQLPQEKRVQPPTQFLTHVYCGQMTGWIMMPLGTEINLGQGAVVLDDIAGAHPPVFGPCLLWPNGWMDDDTTWY